MPTTIDEVRLDAIEKRMDKYDEIVGTLRDAVVELKATSENSYRWMTGLIAVSSVIIGGIIGHFVH